MGVTWMDGCVYIYLHSKIEAPSVYRGHWDYVRVSARLHLENAVRCMPACNMPRHPLTGGVEAMVVVAPATSIEVIAQRAHELDVKPGQRGLRALH